jgi:hypothetical protein
LTLSRQILFFTPAAIILSKFYNVMGVIYAGPVSDALAFGISATLLVIEMKNLGKQAKESYAISDENIVQNQETNVIVTVAIFTLAII